MVVQISTGEARLFLYGDLPFTGTETKRFANVLRDMLGAASRWSQTFCATEQLLTGLVWFGFCDQTWTRTRLRPGQEAESSKSLSPWGSPNSCSTSEHKLYFVIL